MFISCLTGFTVFSVLGLLKCPISDAQFSCHVRAAQSHRKIEKVVLKVPAIVGGPGDVMGRFLESDFQQPVG